MRESSSDDFLRCSGGKGENSVLACFVVVVLLLLLFVVVVGGSRENSTGIVSG